MALKIDTELKNLIPPLTPEEYRLLEESILNEGCRDKLITWNDNIVDGHNRYEICKKHGIRFEVEERDFESKESVKLWMIDNQKGRRNLTDGWKWELAQTRKGILAEKGRNKQKETLGGYKHNASVLSKVDKTETHNTREELASELGWSTGKVAMADKVWKEAEPEVKEKIKSGETSINQAYQEIKKENNLKQRKQKEIQQTKQNIKTVPIIKKMSAMDFIDTINEADLLLTDPPYFTDGDFTKEISYALSKVKQSGQAYVFAGAYPDEINAYLNINTHHMKLCQILVWNYNNTGQRQPNVRYTSNYQICFYYRGKDAPNINKPADGKEQYACQTINAPDGRLGDRYHKWQKPNELIQRFIKNSTKENDLIFDPFAGSGSTLVNSATLGRLAIGCDIDDEAVKICIDRGCKHEF